jgi:hypothetical protein
MTTLQQKAVFWDVAPCSLVEADWRFRRCCLHDQEVVGQLRRDYAAQYPRRLSSPYSPPLEPEISLLPIGWSWTSGVWLQAWGRMSLHCHVQTASEAHLVSFLMGTGGKWPELEAHNYIQLVPTEKSNERWNRHEDRKTVAETNTQAERVLAGLCVCVCVCMYGGCLVN